MTKEDLEFLWIYDKKNGGEIKKYKVRETKQNNKISLAHKSKHSFIYRGLKKVKGIIYKKWLKEN